MKTRTNRRFSLLIWVPVAALVLIMLVASKKRLASPTVKPAVVEASKVVWQNYPLPTDTTKDIVSDTLKSMEQLRDFVGHEILQDRNLQRLFSQELAQSVPRAQLEHDLMRLNGLKLDCIGQLHRSPDGDASVIEPIQSDIVRMVRSQYDVLWTEDFTGGGVITKDNAWRQLVAESAESDLPFIRAMNDPRSAAEYMARETRYYASFQLIFESGSKVEVRGADYFPVKVIQQHFMEYQLPIATRGPVPYRFSAAQSGMITEALSNLRNVYILRNIALNIDRSKRNVLVLGTYHNAHMAYLMGKYGIVGSFIYPEEK